MSIYCKCWLWKKAKQPQSLCLILRDKVAMLLFKATSESDIHCQKSAFYTFINVSSITLLFWVTDNISFYLLLKCLYNVLRDVWSTKIQYQTACYVVHLPCICCQAKGQRCHREFQLSPMLYLFTPNGHNLDKLKLWLCTLRDGSWEIQGVANLNLFPPPHPPLSCTVSLDFSLMESTPLPWESTLLPRISSTASSNVHSITQLQIKERL